MATAGKYFCREIAAKVASRYSPEILHDIAAHRSRTAPRNTARAATRLRKPGDRFQPPGERKYDLNEYSHFDDWL